MGPLKFFRERRRRRMLAERPIPDGQWRSAVSDLPILSKLSADELARLRNLATIFLAEKEFYPLQGVVVDDSVRIRIAAQACLPILGLDMDWYSDWKTVIVVPDAYEITRSETDASGVVHEYPDELGGEVLHLGPVVLSLTDVQDSGYGDGYNVVVHEAAHKLDGKDGNFDGCPPLPESISYREWRNSFTEAYDRIRNGKKGRRRKPRIDSYAAFSPDEFFAVCVESFFETPVVLRSDFPDVYSLLVRFFKQDPIERLSS
jgi:Mlc titration factor MtfA (ptsG expression regulator)